MRVKRAVGLIMAATAAFVRDNRVRRWFEHSCQHCGSPLSRLVVLAGEAHPKRGVRATLKCRDCGRQHALKGQSMDHRAIFLAASRNTRAYSRRNLI